MFTVDLLNIEPQVSRGNRKPDWLPGFAGTPLASLCDRDAANMTDRIEALENMAEQRS